MGPAGVARRGGPRYATPWPPRPPTSLISGNVHANTSTISLATRKQTLWQFQALALNACSGFGLTPRLRRSLYLVAEDPQRAPKSRPSAKCAATAEQKTAAARAAGVAEECAKHAREMTLRRTGREKEAAKRPEKCSRGSRFRAPAAKLDQFGPKLGQFGPTSEQVWCNAGQFGPNLANVGPMWARLGKGLAQIGRVVPAGALEWPPQVFFLHFASSSVVRVLSRGSCGPNLAESIPMFGRHRPSVTKLAHVWPSAAQICSTPVELGPASRLWPKSARSRPEPARFGRR